MTLMLGSGIEEVGGEEKIDPERIRAEARGLCEAWRGGGGGH